MVYFVFYFLSVYLKSDLSKSKLSHTDSLYLYAVTLTDLDSYKVKTQRQSCGFQLERLIR